MSVCVCERHECARHEYVDECVCERYECACVDECKSAGHQAERRRKQTMARVSLLAKLICMIERETRSSQKHDRR